MWLYKSVTGVTAVKVNEIWCLQQERSRAGCVVTGMLVSSGWECCASQSMWEEQEPSWSRCKDGEAPGLSRSLAWEIKTGAKENRLPPPPPKRSCLMAPAQCPAGKGVFVLWGFGGAGG